MSVLCVCLSCPVCDVRALWPNGWTDHDETWHAVGLVPGHNVLDGDPPPPLPKGHRFPQFSAHICCGQMAAWIKMSLGTEVGLGLREIVFAVDPATPRKWAHPPHPILAHVYCGQMAGWMKDAAWYGSRPRPRPHCTRRGSHLPQKGAAAPAPLFGPCLLWPRSPISATAELLC